MVNKECGFIFSDCERCRFVSIDLIRLLKTITTETIKISVVRMIKMIQEFFLICVVVIAKNLCRKNSSRHKGFANFKVDN